jgi:ankyrin repeat protein
MLKSQRFWKDEQQFPLHMAAAEGNIDEVRILLRTINPNSQDHHLCTPLHLAARSGHIVIIELLLLHNANIHAQNQNDNTPIHSAAYGNQPEAILCLLKYGANKFAKNKDGDTPLHSAAWKGCVLSIQVLADKKTIDDPNNEGDTPLHLAAWNNQPAAVSALQLGHANIKAQNYDGHTPSNLAEKKNHESVLLLLGTDILEIESTSAHTSAKILLP